jgi:hypothetical protein
LQAARYELGCIKHIPSRVIPACFIFVSGCISDVERTSKLIEEQSQVATNFRVKMFQGQTEKEQKHHRVLEYFRWRAPNRKNPKGFFIIL